MFGSKHKVLGLMIMAVSLVILPVALNAVSEATMMFLAIEPGSRANGMGNSYVSVTDDAYAGWWNPGAIAFNRKVQFAGMHSNWLQGSGINDLYYEYLGWNQYFEDIGNLGANVVWMDYGSQQHTSETGEDLGTFHSNEFAVDLVYGYDVTKKIGLGAGFKFLYSNLGPGTGETETQQHGEALSYAFDLGSKFKDVIVPRLDMALVIQNIGPDVTYINDEQRDPLPMTLRAGISYRIFDTITQDEFFTPEDGAATIKHKLTITGDASKILANNDPLYKRFFTAMTDDSAKQEFESAVFGAGAEYNYLDLISLRGGYFYDKAGSITGPCFGVGFHTTFSQKYRIFADFAMVAGGELTDYNKTFSLGLEF